MMRCLGRIMRVDPSSMHPSATLPFSLEGLGIRSAFRSRESCLFGPAGPIGNGQSTPPDCRCQNRWVNWAGSHQLHALKTCRSVLWHWASLASNFHRGPLWQTEPVRCLHEGCPGQAPLGDVWKSLQVKARNLPSTPPS